MATLSQIERDVMDAQLLASYIARNGIQGVEKEISAVTQIVVPFPMVAGVAAPVPASFFQDYQKLADKAAPVTVASLRDSTEDMYWFFPFRIPSVVAFVQVIAALLCLYVLGHLHSDWLTGTDLKAQLEQFPEPLTEDTRTVKEMEAKAIKELLESPPAEGGAAAKPGGAIFEERIQKYAAIEKELAADKTNEPAREPLVKEFNTWGRRAWDDLKPWQRLARIFPVSDTPPQKDDVSLSRLMSLRMLANLQKVVLPMLYGCLGALVYILRSVARDSTQRLFRRENIIDYFIRPLNGAIAGFIIGWFMSPDKAGVIADASVAPFALAFVGGYSLEVLYSILDRLTGSSKKA